ncbi:flagellar type III secretion system pore protein FliP [Marinilactibacillus psychrotolerans]|uniref:Flagellar biosynthetic protein FliP n=1 Tax=Marinilactibacillus psychrotolerans TaxID=191770 RepID=A0A511GY75_9LACT|nr:flagellar type III secretion system pore protein FliP [Marinilactibacillus psychrotolerans]TLQ09346.1 flagellar type III secretion system pore protein FliP [Marinilactibacillus psychrotolerans]GEL66220.1 flagellar biosynthetic protein FliP [Marinilactibacillus psychrotolerans]GEQ35037.1 flagellar biosynthesis protein, FliP [Marinilactibacillus psychrotolerans]SDC26715.1 flagellar biosynthetic protein FliP [Marinilactibacillus psychrotolerans]
MVDNLVDVFSNTGESSEVIDLYLLLLLIALIPSFLVLTTSFTRMIVVLSFTRNALGTQQTPPNQVLIGLALFLSLFVMRPVYEEVNDVALTPMLEGDLSREEAFVEAEKPIKDFMLDQTRTSDIELFVDLSGEDYPETPQDLPLTTIIPAFSISELRTAFTIGFLIFIPFLVIDVVVSSILMSMGMFMLSPVMISLPFKLLLFVMVDGWYLVVESLVSSFY